MIFTLIKYEKAPSLHRISIFFRVTPCDFTAFLTVFLAFLPANLHFEPQSKIRKKLVITRFGGNYGLCFMLEARGVEPNEKALKPRYC